MGLLERILGRQDRTVGEVDVWDGIDSVIDLRGEVPDIDLREKPADTPTVLGEPGRCPECGGAGYLDRIDVRQSLQRQHCTSCSHEWTIAID